MMANLIVLAIVVNCAQIALASFAFPCKNSNHQDGYCQLLEECPPLNKLYSKGQLNPMDICSLKGKITVCCESQFVSRINPSPLMVANKKRPSQKYCDELKESLPEGLSEVIINGEQADRGEFAHMAGLFYPNNQGEVNCGGTLIRSNYVATAAHCVLNRQKSVPTKVILGTIDMTIDEIPDPEDERMEIEVESICVHPEYQSKVVYNDIALLRLKTPIRRFTASVHPACLYSGENFPENKTLHITGWGGVNSANAKSRFLLKAHNQAYGLDKCNETFIQDQAAKLPRGLLSSQICTRDTRGIHSSSFCRGDSGGPLQSILDGNKGLFNFIGIMSYGLSSCGGEYPVIYTRVAHYLDWIEQIVWSNGTSTNHLCRQRRSIT